MQSNMLLNLGIDDRQRSLECSWILSLSRLSWSSFLGELFLFAFLFYVLLFSSPFCPCPIQLPFVVILTSIKVCEQQSLNLLYRMQPHHCVRSTLTVAKGLASQASRSRILFIMTSPYSTNERPWGEECNVLAYTLGPPLAMPPL